MLCKLTVSGIKFVASRCRPGILVKRNYSEFPESFPSTKGVADGKYLVNAVLAHDTGTVLDILESGVDPNFRSEQNVTPLMMAAENNAIGVIVPLLKHGADLNLQDDLGETALMKASRESHKDVVHMLIDHGAQADILNYENMTAREATLDVEVDAMLSGTKGEEATLSAEDHGTMNEHSKKCEEADSKEPVG